MPNVVVLGAQVDALDGRHELDVAGEVVHECVLLREDDEVALELLED